MSSTQYNTHRIPLHDIKRPPDQQQLAFIDLARKARELRAPSQDEINRAISNQQLHKMATALRECDSEPDFWKIWDALEINYPPMQGWRDMVTVPAELVKHEDEDQRFTLGRTGKRVFRTLSMEDVYEFPDPEDLIANLLQMATVSMIFGESNTGKTFIALSLALCVAYGRAWLGRPVKQGKVLYIYAEGRLGLKKRLMAYCKYYGLRPTPNIQFIAVPVHLLEDRQSLLDTISEQVDAYTLIVIDTYSNCASGTNQNDQSDVERVLSTCHEVVRQFGAHVLVVHHSNLTGKYNGSAAFKNHVDTMIEIKKDKDETTITLHSEKTRDVEPFFDFNIGLKVVDLGINEETLTPITSCVVVASNAAAEKTEELSEVRQKMLQVLSAQGRASYNTWKRACKESELVKDTAFYEHVNWFTEQKLVKKEAQGPGKPTWYEVMPTSSPSSQLVRPELVN